MVVLVRVFCREEPAKAGTALSRRGTAIGVCGTVVAAVERYCAVRVLVVKNANLGGKTVAVTISLV